MATQMHEGHRQRMRERIERYGIEGLQDHEVLEYLLYSFVPRKDTNELAHRLIDEFGSLANVFNADAHHLAEVCGMTANASLFLSVLPEIFRKYLKSDDKKITLKNRGEVRDYLGKLFIGLDEERVYAIALDMQCHVLACDMLAKGSRAQVDLKAVQVEEFAKKRKAVSVILAHNHPSGSVAPSAADIALTREICLLLSMVGFELQDNFIFNSKGESYSFEENNQILDMKHDSKCFKEGIWKK